MNRASLVKRVSLVAIRPMSYRGRSLQKGDPFEANIDHARTYRAMKWAELAPKSEEAAPTPAAPEPAPVYQTRAMQPEPEPTPFAEPTPSSEDKPDEPAEVSTRRRAYRRRDMRSED